jgi:PPK2 family polyphosphate:nucleotide phosphotransferase
MDQHRIKPGSKVNLAKIDPADKSGWEGSKKDAAKEVATLCDRMDQLQEMLYAESKYRVLIVLQAMDTGGKDGVIRAVFGNLNPQGCRVASFKVPTPPEMAHDYLWRVHQQTPGKGEIVIFNRSHYEDVLVVRVHNFVPQEVWEKRYDQINAWEKTLADEGTTILKFFLHISKDEQKLRLEERRDTPSKQWKFNPGDLKERALWPDYMAAYEAVLSKTSTKWAPWYVVPANSNWYRNLVVARTVVAALEGLNPQYPKPAAEVDLTKVVIE